VKVKCCDCQAWKMRYQSDGFVGECRVNAPIVPREQFSSVKWPSTREDDWCMKGVPFNGEQSQVAQEPKAE